MEIVVPQRIEAEAPLRRRPHQPGVLRFVLRDDDRPAAARLLAHAIADRRHHVTWRRIEDLLRGIEPQPVEVKLVDPVSGVGDEELAHRTGVGAVEIDGVAPFVLVTVGEVGLREHAEVVPGRTEMVVDDVQDDADPERVRAVDERPQVVGMAIEVRRRVRIDPVVAPAEAAVEFGDRHQFDDGDPELRQFLQLGRSSPPRPLLGKRACMKLVQDLAGQRHAGPRAVGPLEGVRIDDL